MLEVSWKLDIIPEVLAEERFVIKRAASLVSFFSQSTNVLFALPKV